MSLNQTGSNLMTQTACSWSAREIEDMGILRSQKEVWLHLNRKPCFAGVAPIRFGSSMVSNPQIQIFMLSASFHIFTVLYRVGA